MSNDLHLKKMALALRRLNKLEQAAAIDPNNLAAKPSTKQQAILDSFGHHKITVVRGGNQSSKTTLGARTFSWMLSETHPSWTRPAEWGTERLQILILGKTGKIIEESLYYRIKSYMDPSELHEFRAGNILQKVIHKPTGNTLLFQSYENVNQARERIQSYTAHAVWIDEMPNSIDLFNESLRRIQKNQGYFWATFTPLIVNNEIRSFCDNLPEAQGQMFKIHMFDNPVYTPDKQALILQEMNLYPEHIRRCRLEGEWMSAESAVYFFDPQVMVAAPENYSPGWRHVESSDPAITTAHGMTVWAEDPNTGHWYCVKAEYLSGLRDTADYAAVVKQKTMGYNIVRRIYDSAAPWYEGAAAKLGMRYMPIVHKSNRKLEMMKNLQLCLGQTLFIAPWCHELIAELTTMQWSNSEDQKIAKSSKYHLHDSAVYFNEMKPKYEGYTSPVDYWTDMRQAHHARKEQAYEAKQSSPNKVRGFRGVKTRKGAWGKPWGRW